jgi:anaerobic selenocysteine-containing dehydrogenase
MKAHITPQFFQQHSIQSLSELSDYELNRKGRLAHPVYLPEGASHYESISWDDAFELIANKLNATSSPNNSVFYTSGRTSNEAAFLYQAFVRAYGTNNLPDCSNMCHESSGKGLGQTIGIGKGTVTLEDFNHSDVIMVIGQNPGTNHPRMLTALRDAKKNGARIIHVNPLPEAGLMAFKHPQDYMKGDVRSTTLADIHLPVRIGGDAALLKGLMKIQMAQKAFDSSFIKNKTKGFESLTNHLDSVSWKEITSDSGLTKEQIEEAGLLLANSGATIACWAMGLTQHRNGVAVIQEVVNLLLMNGPCWSSRSRLLPGSGPFKRSGRSNRWHLGGSYGIVHRQNAGRLGLRTSKRTRLRCCSLRFKPCEREMLMFSSAWAAISYQPHPIPDITAKALQNVGLTVQVSTKLNRSHLVTGKEALILPCLGRTELDVQGGKEQFVTVENSMGIVHRSRGGLKPASSFLKSEPWIVGQLAQATLGSTHLPWTDLATHYDSIRDLMERSLVGFTDYNSRVRQPNGFALPNPPRDEQSFATPDGMAHFTTHELPHVHVEKDHYVLMTLRSHDQYNTTIYGLHDRYRGIHGHRRVLLMNAEDMVERGWKTKQKINITSHFNGEKRHSENWLLIPYEIPRGNLAAYFPEANSLIPLESTADVSNTPTSKWIVCSLSSSKPTHGEEEE